MGTRERADMVAEEVIHRLTALAHTAVSEGRTEEALGYLASVLDRTSGAAEDPAQAKDIDHDVVNAMAVEVLRVHTALRRRM
jgi:thioredoxin-like negative regulator of GroEL